ncbi:glucocorticoid receptor-like (DNA-binding domain) [Exidia glandulosa HHB12029]|uniref:Glucocorticoid receptor-like (DNA-binding domain) n=1 Tax=Exidia glandulosa HHB12029 TaxID=1314781 RepID=A0A165QP22_EXIGL|nr:glucocorticoid receptor-like (DNA-binding domain) [Exidia glandulosa HHB12029]
MTNIRILRDIRRRSAVHQAEIMRRAYLAVARNQTLPAQVRYQAQLQLNNMPPDTRQTQVKNRCVESGRGRGIISEFGLSRYQFRLKALEGELPGVEKATW